MPRRVLCKFFAHGTCLKGDSCDFSHDRKAPSSNICNFYQKGSCTYGSRCRYDHVKITRLQHGLPSSSISSTASSSSKSHYYVTESSSQVSRASGSSFGGECNQASKSHINSSASRQIPSSLGQQTWKQTCKANELLDENGPDSSHVKPADLPICSFAAAGCCPHGERCPDLHGDLCSICEKHCLHPHRPVEREEHIKLCQKNNKQLEALKYSQEIECCICLDRVLSKPTAAERKFGLLSECDHPFCISCIRNWRNNSPSSGMNVNTALRACPLCRKLSYFVVPSSIWYSTKEEKQEIVDNYKSKLKSIDCKYFDFGNATCPFGTSCFYKHTYLPSRNRPNNRRRRYTPHPQRPSQANIEEEIDNFFSELFIANEYDDYFAEYLQDQISEEFGEFLDLEDQGSEDFDDEDAESLPPFGFFLMAAAAMEDSDYNNFSSDDEI